MSKKSLMVSMSIVMTMLMFACKKDEPVTPTPQANFYINGDFYVDYQVAFSNACVDATKYSWDFGDGATSTESSPTHVYFIKGTYTVKLTAINGSNENTKTKSITIAPKPITAAPKASFTVVTNGNTSTFTNTSIDGVSYVWDFGDGSPISKFVSPTHTFAYGISQNVKLWATNSLGTGSYSKSFTTTFTTQPPVASFTASSFNMTTSFKPTSTDATSYLWDFGDGATSTEGAPRHTYTTAGTYTVTLTVTNSLGANTMSHSASVAPNTDGSLSRFAGTYTVNISYHHEIVPAAGSPTIASSWDDPPVTETWRIIDAGDYLKMLIIHSPHDWELDLPYDGNPNGVYNFGSYKLNGTTISHSFSGYSDTSSEYSDRQVTTRTVSGSK